MVVLSLLTFRADRVIFDEAHHLRNKITVWKIKKWEIKKLTSDPPLIIFKNDSKITDDPNDTLHYYEIVNDQIVEKTSNSGGSSGGRRRNRKRKTSKRRRSNKKAKSSKRR